MDVVVRALVVFVGLWLVTRLLGKRTLGQMNAFDLVLVVVMGDLVQQGVTQEDYSITGAFLAVGTMALAASALQVLSWRSPRVRSTVEGLPTVVVREGRVLDAMLDAERVPLDELLEAMRQQGIRAVAEVDLGLLEPDGSWSFFRREAAGS
jgi:uncharacterized membrane protein YcaP (DUF421 family)